MSVASAAAQASTTVRRRGALRLASWAHRFAARDIHRSYHDSDAEARAVEFDADSLSAVSTARCRAVLRAARERDAYSLSPVDRGDGGDRPWEILAGHPVVSRDDLQRMAPSLFAQSPDGVTVRSTSGSAGRPTHVLKPDASRGPRAAVDRRLFDRLGAPAILQATTIVPWKEARTIERGATDWRVTFGQIGIDEALDDLARDRSVGDVLLASPDVARVLIEGGAPVGRLVSAFELSAASRSLALDKPYGALPLAEMYSASELCAPVAFRYPDCPELHVNADVVHVEVLDEHGFATPGYGRVVVTDLLNVAMPLLRYELGDIGSLTASGCACGRVTPALRLLGRSTPLGRPAERFRRATTAGQAAGEILVQRSRLLLELWSDGRAATSDEQAAACEAGVELVDRRGLSAQLRSAAGSVAFVSMAARYPLQDCRGRTPYELASSALYRDPRVTAGVRLE